MPLPNPAPITLQEIQTEFGTTGLVASSTAAGLDPLPTSMLDFLGLSNKTTYTYTTPGTYYFTVPSGKTTLNALVVGGGGGGGGAFAGVGTVTVGGEYTAAAGGGGGGGAMVGSLNVTITPGYTMTIIVGAGGTGGSNAPGNGGTGGTSSFNFSSTGPQPRMEAWGGVGGRYAKRFTQSGNGGASGQPIEWDTYWTGGYAGGTASWGAIDDNTGGGGGGAGGAGEGGSDVGTMTGYGGVGASFSMPGITSSVLAPGGNGGFAVGLNNGTGAAGAVVGAGGGGAAAACYYTDVAQYGGGAGASGGVQFYL